MRIEFWEARPSRSPVLEFVQDQEPDAASRMLKDVERLEDKGLSLLADKNKMRKFQGYRNLYELKTSYRGVWYRILFTIIKGCAYLVEAFKKKSNDTPERNIQNALNRIALITV